MDMHRGASLADMAAVRREFNSLQQLVVPVPRKRLTSLRVAFSGVSGSGKTSTINRMITTLSASGYKLPRRINEIARDVFFSPIPCDNIPRLVNQLTVVYAQVIAERGDLLKSASSRRRQGFISDRALYDCAAYLAAVHPDMAPVALGLLSKFQPNYDVIFYLSEVPNRPATDRFREEFLRDTNVDGTERELDKDFKRWLLSILPAETIFVPMMSIADRARFVLANCLSEDDYCSVYERASTTMPERWWDK